MLQKKVFLLTFLFSINFIKCESILKKSLEYYLGIGLLKLQQKSTKVEFSKSEEKFSPDSDLHTEDSKNELESKAHINFREKVNESYPVLLREASIKCRNAKLFNHGFIFSIYLGEATDYLSFGFCLGNQNYTEDAIQFNYETERIENKKTQTRDKNDNVETPEAFKKKEQELKELNQEFNWFRRLFPWPRSHKKKGKTEKKIDQDFESLIILKRNIPIMAGFFIQLQNDDLDSYNIAAKLGIMVGKLDVYIQRKDEQTFVNGSFFHKNSSLICSTPVVSCYLSIQGKFLDCQGFIICGVSWAPIGISFQSEGISSEDLEQGENSEIIKNKFTTNHLHFFVAIGLGFLF